MDLPTNRLWNTREAAYYLNIQPTTLKKWRVFGKGPEFTHVGGAVKYDPAAVMAFAAASGSNPGGLQ
jgi:hypothetical protein